MSANDQKFLRRRKRVRRALKKVASSRPRLSVHRSHLHIYAQVIDDANGVTLAAASTIEKDLRGRMKNGGNKSAATEVGKMIAERAIKAGVKEVMFDRGAYKFHGRVKALADAARAGGLSF
jgi:large subunit ribosomal protein L18